MLRISIVPMYLAKVKLTKLGRRGQFANGISLLSQVSSPSPLPRLHVAPETEQEA